MLILIDEIEVYTRTSAIEAIIESSPPIQGISSAHCITEHHGAPQIWDLSVNAESNRQETGKTVLPGQCIIVKYEFEDRRGEVQPKLLVAVVTSIKPIRVTFCKKLSERRFKPDDDDTGEIKSSGVIRILPQPNFIRGAFEFDQVIENVDL